jgi:glycerol-3-phosphate acyltransferase PlsY
MLNFFLALLISGVISYLLGSINFAIIITKLFTKKDIRDYGSGNAGMTNVLRSVNKNAAVLTLLGDFLKGSLAAFISRMLFSLMFVGSGALANFDGAYIGVIFAMLGHLFPVFYQFRGGKGISVCGGAILVADWRVFLLILLTFLIFTLTTKYVSLGSIMASVGYTIYTVLLGAFVDGNPHFLRNAILALVATVFTVYKHKANIKRLINKTENKLGDSKKIKGN